MREILFRGKRKDNGEWVEGNFVKGCVEDFAYIVEFGDKEFCRNYVEVIPESVSEFTGLTDKNGKKIFEGDIVKIELRDKSFVNTSVYFMNGYFKHSFNTYLGNLVTVAGRCEIIGNIHDNPELLKGGVNNGFFNNL